MTPRVACHSLGGDAFGGLTRQVGGPPAVRRAPPAVQKRPPSVPQPQTLMPAPTGPATAAPAPKPAVPPPAAQPAAARKQTRGRVISTRVPPPQQAGVSSLLALTGNAATTAPKWVPQGPDLRSNRGDTSDKAATHNEDTSTAPTQQQAAPPPPAAAAAARKAASKAPARSTQWLGAWGTGAAGGGAGGARGTPAASAAGRAGAASQSAESPLEALQRKRAMLQSWGDVAGQDVAAARGTVAAAAGAAESAAGTARTAVVQPGLVQRPNGSWMLQGCDAEMARLPVVAATLRERLTAAIRAEQQAETEALSALYSRTSVARLQRDGVVLAGLRAQPEGLLYRNTLWRFDLPPSSSPTANSTTHHANASRQRKASGSSSASGPAVLPYHKFRPGESILVSRFDVQGADPDTGTQGKERQPSTTTQLRPDRLARASRKATSESTDNTKTDNNDNNSDSNDSDSYEEGAATWHVEGTVVEVKRTYVQIALERKDSDRLERQLMVLKHANKGSVPLWRLDASVRDVTANRQREALQRLDKWTTDAKAGEALVRLALVSDTRTVSVLAAQPPVWARADRWREAARRVLAAQSNLNDSQRRAVARAMVQCLTLWQGPPGTGKTRTLLALITVLVGSADALHGSGQEAMGPLLACADTNAAVDNIVEGLQARGMRVVRIGNPAKVRPALRQFTLEALAERDTPEGRTSVRLRQQAEARMEEVRRARESAPSSISQSLVEKWAGQELSARTELERADTLLKQGMELVLSTAQVVCATCAGSGDALIANQRFRVVVIDEATQATEPATLVPLVKGAECVVMAGDPKQLPPTVTSREALQYQLDVTLFERLNRQGGLLPLLLDTQYRMHPALSAFPSQQFYGSRLKDGVGAQDKPTPRALHWPEETAPVVFLQVRGVEERASVAGAERGAEGMTASTADNKGSSSSTSKGISGGGYGSYRNAQEAQAAIQVLEQLVSAGDVSSVALLTPYKGQVRLLEALLRQLPPDLTQRMESGQLEVTVSSVDGFQGREADVVIFSAVRCNTRGQVGFVSDPRRINVAITRPRRGLVLLGCDDTLSAGSEDWRTYLEYLREQNVVVPLSKVLPQRRNSKTTLAIPALSSTSSSDEDDSHPGNGSETAKATTTNKRRSASTKSLQSSQANHGGSMDNNGAPAHEPALPSRTSQVSKEGSTDADGLITLNSNVVHAGEAISMPVKASAKRTRAASARIKTAASARAAADAEANTHGPDVIGAQGGKKSVRGRSKGGDIASVGASVGEPAAKSGWSV